MIDLLGLHDEAVRAGRCFVTGAGFGLLATERVVLKLCEGLPPAASVRVDALPFVDDAGPLGDTLAATIIEGLPMGGRRSAPCWTPKQLTMRHGRGGPLPSRLSASPPSPSWNRRATPAVPDRRRVARVQPAAPAQKRDSWTHARVQWSDGRVREGWLRAGEAMAFTNAVTTAVTLRLAGNEGTPGAYTPGALFGADLAVQAGGQFIIDRGA